MANTGKGIVLKLISAVLFAVMSALVRFLGTRYPIGEVVFYRSAFAIVPVMAVYAWRGELASVVRTERPLGQAGRGAISIVGMFCNFGALARLPLVEANAISFTTPLFSVALAAFVLKERVRIYRWSAVIVGFIGVLVVLSPHLSGDELTFAAMSAATAAGLAYALTGALANAGTVIQTRRLAQSETTSSIVFYFLAVLRACWLGYLAVRLGQPDRRRIRGADRHRRARRHRAYLSDRELPLRLGLGRCAVRLHGHDMGADPRLHAVRRDAHDHDRCRLADHRRSRIVRDLARAAIGGGAPAARAGAAGSGRRYVGPNALNVRMVRVSAMPGTVCTFSAMKWPMSVPGST